MKILHAADLHLGQTFHSFDRSLEQKTALGDIESIIADNKPDAYVISGDVFHTITPQAGAEQMLISHLMHVHELAPQMKIVVTAGNHDSNRIEIDDPLWNLIGVSVIASIKRNIIEGEDSGEYHKGLFARHIIPVGCGEEVKGYIIAIPHCFPANFPSVRAGLPREEREKAYVQLLLDEVARRNVGNLPVVVMAHAAVRRSADDELSAPGQDLSVIGGIDLIDADVLGTGYDYVALGHIHYAQNVTERMRYSGSMLPTSFDENYQHSVSLVEIAAHGDMPKVDVIPVANVMPVITIPEQEMSKPGDAVSLPWEEAIKALREFPADREGYLRLNVTDDGTIPSGANDIAAKSARELGLKAKFCLVNRVRKEVETEETAEGTRVRLTTSQLSEMTPLQVAELSWREKFHAEIPVDLKALMQQAINESAAEPDE